MKAGAADPLRLWSSVHRQSRSRRAFAHQRALGRPRHGYALWRGARRLRRLSDLAQGPYPVEAARRCGRPQRRASCR
ncbi:hypothetical protein ACRAWD_27785 [Caulobacter segnis]